VTPGNIRVDHVSVRRTAAFRALRLIPIVVAVVSIVVAVIGFVLFDTDPSIYRERLWLVKEVLPGAIVFSLAGAILLGHRQARAVGGVLLACGCVGSLYLLACGFWYWELYNVPPWGYSQPLTTIVFSVLGSAFFVLMLIVLPQVFPNGLLPGRGWVAVLVASLVVQVPTIAYSAYFEYLYDLLRWEDEDRLRAEYAGVALVLPQNAQVVLWNSPVWVAGLVAMATLLVRWRRGSTLVRQQIGWLVAAGLITAVLTTIGYTAQEWIIPLVAIVWPLAVVAIISLAVLQHHLFDIRVVIRRVVVYGALTGLITVLFVGVYSAVLAGASTQVSDVRVRWVAGMAAAAGVVLLAEPARRRLMALLEARFLGARRDPLAALARLQDRVVDGAADDIAVLRTVAETVAAAVRSPSVAVAVHRGPQLETAASTGEEEERPLVRPLLYRGERLGELRVGHRTPGESYGRADIALLDQLAYQTAALVYGLRRDTELAQVRRESLEALAEVQTRVGRDLHDGIAPLLAGAGLSAEALRMGMPEGTNDERKAEQLAVRLRTAASEVRRLAHDLALDGAAASSLEADLRRHVATLKGPAVPEIELTIQVAEPLPGAVRQGAYLVILEAMNNVIRHARARHLRVRVNGGPDELVLEVADDGVGLDEPYVSGLGVTSMRSRIQALGGTFDLAAGAVSGTHLKAILPVRT
jgi:signal transduction histidine kinase